jgi:hypothetical protein
VFVGEVPTHFLPSAPTKVLFYLLEDEQGGKKSCEGQRFKTTFNLSLSKGIQKKSTILIPRF